MRRVPYLLALPVLAAAVAGCGGVSRTIDPVAAAATRTEKAGGAAMTISMSMSAGGKQITVNGHGAFDGDQGELDFDVVGLGRSATAKELYLTENGDPVIYMNVPELSSQLPGGKSWFRLDLQKAGKALGVDVSGLLSASSQNPGQALQTLESNGTFTNAGTETIDGVSTRHYKGAVDLAQAAKNAGAADLFARLAAAGAPTSVPTDVWVDDAGYVRQLKENLSDSVGGQQVSLDMTIKMSDYGETVNVSAPPADQTFDATQLATSLTR